MSIKEEETKIIQRCAMLFDAHLKNREFLMVFLNRIKNKLDFIEVTYRSQNYLHLTGAKTQFKAPVFYDRCLAGKLSESDWDYDQFGFTKKKIEILKDQMTMPYRATMIGDYNYSLTHFKLSTEEIYGNMRSCIGCIYEESINSYIPNTSLLGDVRDFTNDYSPIKMIFVKNRHDQFYKAIAKQAKGFDINDLPNNIKEKIDFSAFSKTLGMNIKSARFVEKIELDPEIKYPTISQARDFDVIHEQLSEKELMQIEKSIYLYDATDDLIFTDDHEWISKSNTEFNKVAIDWWEGKISTEKFLDTMLYEENNEMMQQM